MSELPDEELSGAARANRDTVAVRLVSRVRAHEVLGAAVKGGVLSCRRDGRPDREPGVAVVHAMGVELGHVDGACSAGEGRLRERVDLRSVKVVAEKRVLVGRDVDAVGVNAKVRVVADARVGIGRHRGLTVRCNSGAAVVWSSVVAVVLSLHAVDRPAPGRAGRIADCKVDVVGAGEVTAGREDIQGEHHGKPSVGVLVVKAARVRHERPDVASRAVELRRIAEEGVQVFDACQRRSCRRVDGHHVIDDLHDDAVARAQALVRRFQRELVAAVGEALLPVVESVKRAQHRKGPGARHTLTGGDGNHSDARGSVRDRAASVDLVTVA